MSPTKTAIITIITQLSRLKMNMQQLDNHFDVKCFAVDQNWASIGKIRIPTFLEIPDI